MNAVIVLGASILAALIMFVGPFVIYAGWQDNRRDAHLDDRIAARFRAPANRRSW